MSQRSIAAVTLVALVASAVAGLDEALPDGSGGSAPQSQPPLSQARPTAQSKRPNVVVILTDDQDVRSTRAMPAVMRELAGRGVTFMHNFATDPLCCPSRATFLTGEYAHNHRVLGNDPPLGGYPAFLREVPPSQQLQVRLSRAGYLTGYVGKYLNVFGSVDPSGVPPGWSSWNGLVHNVYGMYGYTLSTNGGLATYGSAPSDYQTDVLAGRARSFLRGAARTPGRPFFLTFAPVAPHEDSTLGPNAPSNPVPAPRYQSAFAHRPLPRPPSFNEPGVGDKPRIIRRPPLTGPEIGSIRSAYRSRLESLLSVDDAVRGIVATLRRTGELANTLILYTSDNGLLLGEHRLRGKNLPYEESVGVPLIVRGPGLPRGVRRSQLTGNIDLAPTILEAANLGWRRRTDGVSLLPLARRPDRGRDRAILYERFHAEGRPFKAIRTRRYVYIDWAGAAAELYDLHRDPFELRNRAGDSRYGAIRHRLAGRLASLRDCAGPGCR